MGTLHVKLFVFIILLEKHTTKRERAICWKIITIFEWWRNKKDHYISMFIFGHYMKQISSLFFGGLKWTHSQFNYLFLQANSCWFLPIDLNGYVRIKGNFRAGWLHKNRIGCAIFNKNMCMVFYQWLFELNCKEGRVDSQNPKASSFTEREECKRTHWLLSYKVNLQRMQLQIRH